MNNRRLLLPFVFLLAVFAVFIIRRWNEPQRREAFDRTPAKLLYTEHARCRMDCRGIDEGEVREVMEKGVINFNKSNRHGRPCPTFALQRRTAGGENLRVVFAQCGDETKVVTCYNLEKEFTCDCPGDKSKNQ